MLNATEDLIHGSMGDGQSQMDHSDLPNIPPAEARRLDEQLSRLEENVCTVSVMNISHAMMSCFSIYSDSFHRVQVYVAAGTVYGLEAELGDLEECARSISGSTTERDLAHLEDQVASAAAQVQQSELQVRSAWTLCSLSLSESHQQHLIALKTQ